MRIALVSFIIKAIVRQVLLVSLVCLVDQL